VFGDPQINFYVQDVEASARFYRESFGFTETFRTPRSGRPIHVEMRLDQLTLGFARIDSARDMHGHAPHRARPLTGATPPLTSATRP
jgi:catechol 2,3-dioxygenase-like lactoylglutathione lyase family enzyme